jgi:hypothetical protein
MPWPGLLVLLGFHDIFVAGDPRPLPGPGSLDKAWMPPSCHMSSMTAASTPYDLVRAAPVWLESAYCTGQRHPRCWWLVLTPDKDGSEKDTRAWISSFAAGSTRFVTTVIMVHGTTSAGTGRRASPRSGVKTFRFSWPFRTASSARVRRVTSVNAQSQSGLSVSSVISRSRIFASPLRCLWALNSMRWPQVAHSMRTAKVRSPS